MQGSDSNVHFHILLYCVDFNNADVDDLFSVGAYTCSVTCCRTLLARIAVEAGADPNKNFRQYVMYIEEECPAPFMKKDWLDKIGSSGNSCVHDLVMADKDLAYDMIRLGEILLNSIYNVPDAKTSKKDSKAN